MGRPGVPNVYSELVDYLDASKATWMAIAVSLANRIGQTEPLFEKGEAPITVIMTEWETLYDNGIVLQKPRRD